MCALFFLILKTISTNSQQVMGPGANGFRGKISGNCSANYPTWKVQCWMALIRDGLWGFVAETKDGPVEPKAEKYANYLAQTDQALATIVLAVEPSLLYLLGDPQDTAAV